MRITAVDQNKPASSLFTMTQLARRAMHATLEQLTIGSLTVVEQSQVSHFGNKDDERVTAVIQVKDPAVWLSVLKDGDTGAGEAYMLGHWDSPNLMEVIRLFVLNMQTLQAMSKKQPLWRKLAGKAFLALRANSLGGSRRNISAHYDLSNEFFSLFLDPSMAYSAAIFKHEKDTLHVASTAKFQHICERLQLAPGDHLL
ncbi:MAG: SAM-dependent methyltransferase, partial [Desulfobulbaceae bacterium]